MKKSNALVLSAIMLTSLSGTLLAQDSDYHPAMTDNFILSVGAFRSDNSFDIRAEGKQVGSSDIDFGNSIGVDESSTIANVQLRWNFGKERKWSLWGQYFSNNAKGDATLEEDVEWQDVIFNAGTFVDGSVKLEITRVFLGRSFIKNEQHDFGAGLGIHNLDFSAYIGGELMANGASTGYQRVDAGASQILPNLGSWYKYSPASKWLLHGRVDWISANIGDYDGTMWNVNAGVNYQAWRHVGIDLSYQYFNLDVNVDSNDLRGGINMSYSGPVVSVTANW